MFKKIYNIELSVRNWNASPHFYEHLFGMQIHEKSAEKGYREYWVGEGDAFFCLGLPIFYQHPDHVNRSIHLSLQVDDLEKTVKTLEARGVKTLGVIKEFDKMLLTDIYDPEGYELAIVQLKQDPFTQVNRQQPPEDSFLKQVYNVELAISDWDNTPRWYEEVLELRPIFRAGPTGYREYKVGSGQTLLALGHKPSEDASGGKNKNVFIGIEVADINQALQSFKQKGWEQITEVRSVAGRIFEANVIDPEGYQLAIIQRNPSYRSLLRRS